MSDMMSQEEIEALLSMGEKNEEAEAPAAEASGEGASAEILLTAEEQDTLGEVGNICMGTAATTMYTLLGHRVDITTPRVCGYRPEELLKEYAAPYIAVEVMYTEGVRGNNLLLLREYDAAVITDLMMGGDGKVEEPIELSELHLSAISEVMNQMVGSSATSLSEMLHTTVNISPPTATLVDLSVQPQLDTLSNNDFIIKISFEMVIEGLLTSELMQVMPLDFGRELVQRLKEGPEEGALPPPQHTPPPPPPLTQKRPAEQPAPAPAPAPEPPHAQGALPAQAAPQHAAPPPGQYDPQQYGAYPPPAPGYGYPGYPPPAPGYGYPQQRVDVQPVQYQQFDAPPPMDQGQNIGLIIDVPLQVTVELGKTKKSIKDVLDFGVGSIIVLDKLAGDLVDVMVNGKRVAKGEVVVIDENYGVRISEIISSGKRI